MRSPSASLARLYFKTIYGLKPLSSYTRPRDRLKLAGIVLLSLVLLGDFGFIFVSSAIAQYDALKPQGLEGLLLLNAAMTASMIVFVFGFIMSLSTYSLSPAEESLLALPLRPRALLASKFVVVYLSEFLFALFLVGVNLAVFGLREAPPLLFYVYGLLIALSLPLLPLAVAWIILVPLLSLARFLRNKNAVMLVGGFVGIAFAVAFNVWVQGSMLRMNDQAWILRNYAGPETVLNFAGSLWPPSWLAWKALSLVSGGHPGAGLGYALAGPALGLVAALAVVYLLGTAYVRSLLGFGEGTLRKLARGETRTFIARGFRRRSLFIALLARENRLMNREPIYFLNGPFGVVLGPVIIGVMYFVQRSAFAELASAIEGLRSGPYGLLIGAAFGAFLGSSTSITCTGLSRDAKNLAMLRAMPIPVRALMLAKLAHGLCYALLGALVGGIGVGLILVLDPISIAGSVFIALSFAALANMAGLWIDTAWPRLTWDNPISALKQNPNSVFAILGAMGCIVLLGVFAGLVPLGSATFVIVYGGGIFLLFVLLLAAYPPWAEKKLAGLEL
jgi:ABC-2 type transport system permease protein